MEIQVALAVVAVAEEINFSCRRREKSIKTAVLSKPSFLSAGGVLISHGHPYSWSCE